MNHHSKRIILAALLLIFAAIFFRNTASDMPLIFEKDLHSHDESSNSVVAANITRKFFPPMVRVNPLNEKQGVWMEGPQWQHIPPLFAYVPYLFFKLDGQVSIEVKRLSYAFLVLLTGIIFICSIYLFSRRLIPTIAATAASIFWLNTPFTHALITGYTFGVSDIVLAFTVICAFGGMLWYFSEEKTTRLDYAWWKLCLIVFLVSLPIWAKNLLGAIPAATFFTVLIYDHRTLSRKFWVSLCAFLGTLLVYYGPLYLESPETFKNEILVAFFHFNNLEGWGRPWHAYFSEYLPGRYLFKYTLVYWIGLALSFVAVLKYRENKKIQILLRLSLLWFAWNLLAISMVESKIANFIFQTYLLSLFAICLAALIIGLKFAQKIIRIDVTDYKYLAIPLLLVGILFASNSAWTFGRSASAQRRTPYVYDTEREKFYLTADLMRQQGIGTRDLVIAAVSDNDCWFRYNVLFLTGAESKTVLEMYFNDASGSDLQRKYDRLWFVIPKSEAAKNLYKDNLIETPEYYLIKYDLIKLNPDMAANLIKDFVNVRTDEILQQIERIKDDKTSCQWLVPDSVLNSP